jgi:hypothetical protein
LKVNARLRRAHNCNSTSETPFAGKKVAEGVAAMEAAQQRIAVWHACSRSQGPPPSRLTCIAKEIVGRRSLCMELRNLAVVCEFF